jgi:hypothetical protein
VRRRWSLRDAPEGVSGASAGLENGVREGVGGGLPRAVNAAFSGYSAVAGSMIPVTTEILLAGKPPSSAWRRTRASSVA